MNFPKESTHNLAFIIQIYGPKEMHYLSATLIDFGVKVVPMVGKQGRLTKHMVVALCSVFTSRLSSQIPVVSQGLEMGNRGKDPYQLCPFQ